MEGEVHLAVSLFHGNRSNEAHFNVVCLLETFCNEKTIKQKSVNFALRATTASFRLSHVDYLRTLAESEVMSFLITGLLCHFIAVCFRRKFFSPQETSVKKIHFIRFSLSPKYSLAVS